VAHLGCAEGLFEFTCGPEAMRHKLGHDEIRVVPEFPGTDVFGLVNDGLQPKGDDRQDEQDPEWEGGMVEAIFQHV
jgi:hypothetical protein